MLFSRRLPQRGHVIRRAVVLIVAALALRADRGAAQAFYQVSPSASFYLSSPSDNPAAPTLVYVGGYAPGTMLELAAVGMIEVAGPGSPVHNASLCGIFSTSSVLLAASLLDRVPDALATSASATDPCVTVPTFYPPNNATDIPDDFFIGSPPISVTIPAGAEWLFVGFDDNYYADNVSPDPSSFGLELQATETVTPEPAPLLLLATGLACLGLLKHLPRRRPAVG